MIPLYVLIGVWGGPGRLGATVKFVIYTMAGSLLMLAAVIVFGLSQGHLRSRRKRHERQHLALPRLRRGIRGQGAALPVPRLAARRLPRIVSRSRCGPLRTDLEGRGLRLHPDLFRKVPGAVRRLAERHPRARRRRPRLRLAARLPRTGHPRRDRVLKPRPDGPDHDRDLRGERRRCERGGSAVREPRADFSDALPARRGDRTTNVHGQFRPSRRHGPRAARARNDADGDRHHRTGRAGIVRLRRRVPDPRRSLRLGLGMGCGGCDSGSCLQRCTCSA